MRITVQRKCPRCRPYRWPAGQTFSGVCLHRTQLAFFLLTPVRCAGGENRKSSLMCAWTHTSSVQFQFHFFLFLLRRTERSVHSVHSVHSSSISPVSRIKYFRESQEALKYLFGIHPDCRSSVEVWWRWRLNGFHMLLRDSQKTHFHLRDFIV